MKTIRKSIQISPQTGEPFTQVDFTSIRAIFDVFLYDLHDLYDARFTCNSAWIWDFGESRLRVSLNNRFSQLRDETQNLLNYGLHHLQSLDFESSYLAIIVASRYFRIYGKFKHCYYGCKYVNE